MPALLVIAATAYSLQLLHDGDWSEIAALPGGAEALVPRGTPINSRSLEVAIELAEDWLMPHAARLRDERLEVADATGRLQAGLRDVLSVNTSAWSAED